MCGIAGIFDIAGHHLAHAGERRLQTRLDAMADVIQRRGPDGDGLWRDETAAFVHTRLAVIDLSAAANQPMLDHNGRFVISFNGEIYNHRALRDQLGHDGPEQWRGTGDTETLLAAISAWGLEKTLARVDGMYAFALYDTAKHELCLVRDPFGEKPLFYAMGTGALVFASTQASLLQSGLVDRSLDPGVIDTMLRRGYCAGNTGIVRAVRRQAPGSVVRINKSGNINVSRHFDLSAAFANCSRTRFADVPEADAALENALTRSVRRRLQADVPVGVFLSGGIDSSLVAAVAARESGTQKLRTYSIGLEPAGSRSDEAPAARSTAHIIGSEHTELYVNESDIRRVVEQLPLIYDEPFADTSQIPVTLVAELARRDVTVALSGDGGDELFGGYTRHVFGARAWGLRSALPFAAGAALFRALGHRRSQLSPVLRFANQLLPPSRRIADIDHGLERFFSAVDTQDLAAFYSRLLSIPGVDSILKAPAVLVPEPLPVTADSVAESMMLADLAGYLPDDILVKLDRAAMFVGLETRTPYLSRDVFDVAFRIPPEKRIDSGIGKLPLRRLLQSRGDFPHLERPKSGFHLSARGLLAGPLSRWARDMLHLGNPVFDELTDRNAVNALFRRWQSAAQGPASSVSDNDSQLLWRLCVLNQWLDAHRSHAVST